MPAGTPLFQITERRHTELHFRSNGVHACVHRLNERVHVLSTPVTQIQLTTCALVGCVGGSVRELSSIAVRVEIVVDVDAIDRRSDGRCRR